MLTIVMAVYGQPLMLAEQIRTIASYDDDVLDNLSVVVVDDHGDPPVDAESIKDLGRVIAGAKLFRVLDNIAWNQMGARNLGMLHADGWCLMIDPDMVFNCEMIRHIMSVAGTAQPRTFVRYCLRHRDGRIDRTSPNTYLIHRADFFAAGGYDEEYRGHKGWSDVQMLDVLRAHFKQTIRDDLWADFYGTDRISDAAVTSLDRTTAHNKRLRINKQALAKKCGGWVNWVRQYHGPNFRFRWEQTV